jgi:uncharacterized protein YodC (DUF2158 family)
MPNQWKIGDKVQLKSGGPVMTVNSSGPDSAYCVWFDGDKPLGQGFHPEALMRYNEERFGSLDDDD